MSGHLPVSSKDIFDHLLRVTPHKKFLSKGGLGNEIPYFICPYAPSIEIELTKIRHSLVSRLREAGISVLDLNLLDVSLGLLKERGILDQLLDTEADHEKSELRELLQSVLDPETHLVPALLSRLKQGTDLLILSGLGEVFPFVRAHAVLNNLQSRAGQQLTLMFFPGIYAHVLESGATLDVLGLRQEDRYYRAFNILEYEV